MTGRFPVVPDTVLVPGWGSVNIRGRKVRWMFDEPLVIPHVAQFWKTLL